MKSGEILKKRKNFEKNQKNKNKNYKKIEELHPELI